ncbi:SubName: Full=Uncharacterized protein {ECO:0000313/EMBL:CCA66879.1} [Serendipita indica DSM 11827]|nr:SubName: Full=Uncharacterized protein {ECO:0000313/EMBL:CCA66879.1} [Serendipita indica DSM 11827]
MPFTSQSSSKKSRGSKTKRLDHPAFDDSDSTDSEISLNDEEPLQEADADASPTPSIKAETKQVRFAQGFEDNGIKSQDVNGYRRLPSRAESLRPPSTRTIAHSPAMLGPSRLARSSSANTTSLLTKPTAPMMPTRNQVPQQSSASRQAVSSIRQPVNDARIVSVMREIDDALVDLRSIAPSSSRGSLPPLPPKTSATPGRSEMTPVSTNQSRFDSPPSMQDAKPFSSLPELSLPSRLAQSSMTSDSNTPSTSQLESSPTSATTIQLPSVASPRISPAWETQLTEIRLTTLTIDESVVLRNQKENSSSSMADTPVRTAETVTSLPPPVLAGESQSSSIELQAGLERSFSKKNRTSSRNVQISAPVAELPQREILSPPRAAPLPPVLENNRSTTMNPLDFTDIGLLAQSLENTERNGAWANTLPPMSEPSRQASFNSKPRLGLLTQVTSRLLGEYARTAKRPQSSTKSTLPPLIYDSSTPIRDHIGVVSERVKAEFKLKLKNELELPTEDGASTSELVENVEDLNDDVSECVKTLLKLVLKAQSKGSRLQETTQQAMEGAMHSKINAFLVENVFRPFSLELSIEASQALRGHYEQIAPNIPRFIASRWRALAASSTSRPAQNMGPLLASIASSLSAILVEGVDPSLNTDGALAWEFSSALTPLIRQAYLLSHFIHLEMLSADYDVFLGTDIGGWAVPEQEEEYIKSRHFAHRRSHGRKVTTDMRVSAHCKLGLRRSQYIGEGNTRRRVWDVILKPKVLVEVLTSGNAK